MSRQITTGLSPPSAESLERRIAALEAAVAALTETVTLLVRGRAHALDQDARGEGDLFPPAAGPDLRSGI
ncbi:MULTISPECIES: hypothetical protein [Thermomonospora]|uniref:Uncharacterized protein n=1 Tax=Thermomonospora curvata (strain ATCC 19995 / DSM 43183 / JCM 3096 / KCTC 9072 / NBRC 15933 / NCIMB 10081 / Henssen B9) TaxID=471852 RepID=D1ADY2_THECD|nr:MULTISPECIES: hypothetical protein [Thermomonospora]ACY97592.1 hypothetical protein Tcur_2025 [Thermomonospora curvata DSM 43183]PKK14538.1 MAG: hypothetical protein BUE48_009880 [Thermomonospora sp. CIF 1]